MPKIIFLLLFCAWCLSNILIDVVIAVCDCTSTDCQDICTAGDFYSPSTGGCTPCPTGYYCPGGTGGSLTPCSAGTANPDTGQWDISACTACAANQISTEGSTTCTTCPAGYSCNTTTNTQTPCTAGEYSVPGGMDCTLCPVGSICPYTDQSPQNCGAGEEPNGDQSACVDCVAGSYAAESDVACDTCPAGYKCPTVKMTAPTQCPDGEYQTATGQTSCDTCTAGSECSDNTATPNACTAGYYSAAGAIACTACASGSYSSSGGQSNCNLCAEGSYCTTIAETPCGSGTYSLAQATSCLSCDAGTTVNSGRTGCEPCTAGSSCNGTSPTACVAGTYSLAGASSCLPCPTGYYSSSDGESSCTPCTAGSYCTTTGQTQCDAGTYSLEQATTCVSCDAGWYSSAVSSSCTQCSAGSYCNSTTTADCPAGQYSDAGASVCTDCPAGSYSSSDESSCTPCAAGSYCNVTTETPCAAGTYSLTEAVSCSTCYPGSYSSSDGESSCTPCAAGSYCNATTETPCAAGTYSLTEAVSCSTCYPGSYSSSDGESSCTPCAAGSYCNATTETPCDAGTYSSAEATNCLTCSTGYYQPSPGQSGCTECPAGSYCNMTAATDCGPGMYSSTQATACTTCPAGYACPGLTTATPTGCNASTYAPANSASCLTCDTGYECPSNNMEAQTACTTGTFAPNPGATACLPCPAGQQCPSMNETVVDCVAGQYSSEGSSVCTACADGYYQDQPAQANCTQCPEGSECSVKSAAPTACPPGTISTAGQMSCQQCAPGTYKATSGAGSCTPCEAGFECPTTNTTSTACDPGYYSLGSQVACFACPGGHNCTDQTSAPVSCLAGNYAPTGNGTCQICDAGYECPTAGLAEQVACDDGYYQTATGQTSCTECPQGSACADKTAVPCDLGEYQDGRHKTSCKSCPSGWYSDSTGSITCTICPAGSYCANATIAPTACSGTDYSTEGLTACLSCPAGQTCSGRTTTSCNAGEYVNSNVCEPCLAGYSCAVPSLGLVECADGTYQTQTGHTSCDQCPAGQECLSKSGAAVDCEAGYLSPQGSSICSLCDSGTYSDAGAGLCSLCPAGKYCFNGTYYVTPTDCDPGYNSVLGQSHCTSCTAGLYSVAGSSSCSQCEAGYECSDPANPVACTAGNYSVTGETVSCTLCPAGKFCATTSAAPSNCLSGTYSSAGATSCDSCPTGQSCLDPSAAPENCDSGYYSPAGTASCYACPAGFECETDPDVPTTCSAGTYSLAGQSNCTNCPVGSMCPYTDQGAIQCADGQHTDGNTKQTTCTDCNAGSYCPSPEQNEAACSSGSYSRAKATSCTLCPAGSYCATPSSTPVACPVGESSPDGSTNCTGCPSGYSCTSSGTQTQCNPGYYSTGSQTSCTRCPSGWECPDTTGTLYNCTAGQYSYSGATECTNCPSGWACPNTNGTAKAPCPTGHYADVGQIACTECPAGSACADKNIAYEEKCENGSYALAGSTSCTVCPPGFACPDTTIDTQIPCTEGAFSEGGRTACVVCTAGYECPDIYDSLMALCSLGYYSEAGAQLCTKCEAGKQCANNSEPGTDCPDGTYSLAGWIECKACPAGYYCAVTAKGLEPVICPEGEYTLYEGSIDISQCIDCDAGRYCPEGTPSPIECPAGTFNEYTGKEQLSDCVDCLAGMACTRDGLSEPDAPCSAGYFCAGKNYKGNQNEYACPAGKFTDQTNLTQVEQCETCPATRACLGATGGKQNPPVACAPGHYCPAGTGSQTQFPCPAGSYSNLTNLDEETDCWECPPGKYCLEGSVESTGPCNKGHFCPAGSKIADERPCHAGSYSDNFGNHDHPQCDDCTAGHYCPEASVLPTDCPIGTFRKDRKGESLAECTDCTAGYYCPNLAMTEPLPCGKGNYSDTGASFCTTCDAGHYCNQNATSKAAMDTDYICPAGVECPPGMYYQPDLEKDACRVGHYCPRGDVNPYPVPCVIGTFNGEIGLKQVLDCELCTAGEYCDVEGLNATAGFCPDGYYCPRGTGISTSFPCPIGLYRNGAARESFQDCTPCTSGYYCDEEGLGTPKDCPRGYFCVTGSTYYVPCPLGTYGNSTNLRVDTDCTPCPGGYYCDGLGRTSTTDVCDAGFYCREKAYTSAPPEGLTGGLCPAGGYCPAGSATPSPCAVGKYSNFDGAKTQYDCIPCDPGFFCAGSASANATEQCSGGFYCTGGSGVPTQYETEPGYYTLDGAFKMEPCAPGFYQPASKSETCLTCPQGFFCNGTSTVTATICPSGHYCPSQSEWPIPCPSGTYQVNKGQYELAHCDACPPGKACTQDALDAYDQLCAAGHYCTNGSHTAFPIGISAGDRCPPGYYCPEGTADYTDFPCSNGTYSNYTGNLDISNCTECDPGAVCNGFALTAPNGVCHAGFFCRGGASTDQPQDGGTTGDLCTEGHYCPEGTSTQVMCPPGSFMNATGASVCYPCPPGGYCVGGAEGDNAIDCPKGHYCPENTTSAQPSCPAGKYNEYFGASSLDDCLPCKGGHYCDPGATSFDYSRNDTNTGICLDGYFCRSGVETEAPNPSIVGDGGPCPAGFYCLAETTNPTPCPTGTYRDIESGQSEADCFPCTAGNYCDSTNLTTPTGPCDAGYYCLQGSDVPTPTGEYCETEGLVETTALCMAGYYCRLGANTSAPTDRIMGDICPVGSYCPVGSPAPISCTAGTYMNTTGAAACLVCPDRYFCINSDKAEICTQGFYCPEGTGHALQRCPTGTFGATTGLMDVSECSECTGGYYCSSTGLAAPDGQCAGGHYCTSGLDIDAPTASTPHKGTGSICDPGYYCPVGSSDQTICPGGTYSPSQGEESCTTCPGRYYCGAGAVSYVTNECVPGHYCPNGTESQLQYPCPFGTYGPSAGQDSIDSCLLCDPGFYCDSEGLSTTTGECFPGWYCTGGATQAMPITLGNYSSIDQCMCLAENSTGGKCQPGSYCPVKSTAPTACTGGYYCDTYELMVPTGQCSAGYYCQGEDTEPQPPNTECTPGHYCPEGSPAPTQCPTGTFSNATGNTAESDCRNCTAGYYCESPGLDEVTGACGGGFYCPPGQWEPSPPAYICPEGFYCPVGSPQPVICGQGYYTNQVGQETCDTCPRRSYCDPYDAGTPNDTGIIIPVACPPGHYCPLGTMTAYQYPCPSGTYSSVPGQLSADECFACELGKYCERPGLTAAEGDCGAGYFCLSGANTFTPTDGLTGYPCPEGRYCLTGATSPTLCTIGTFNNRTGLAAESECLPCDPGTYCPTEGLTAPHAPCTAGHYCETRSTEPAPDAEVYGYLCPLGHYCVLGTPAPEACPQGTYNPQTGISALDECTGCDGGSYCQTAGNSTVTGPCNGGYYCIGNASTSTPTDGVTGDICPVGKYCPVGTEIYHPCPAGTYMNRIGAETCDMCPKGFKCVGEDSIVACPQGSYCENGTGLSPTSCPIGTFGSREGLEQESDCSQCTGGSYCATAGLPAPTDVCSPGHYCVEDCYPGTYSPEGTAACLPCASGYQSTRGQSSCSQCPAGQQCADPASPTDCLVGEYSEIGWVECVPCPTGYYSDSEGATACTICPDGNDCTNSSLTPTNCAAGTYSTEGTAACLTCASGYYSTLGQANCSQCPAGQQCADPANPTDCLVVAECASDTDSKGTAWPASIPGRTQEKLCPAGYEGDIMRKCTPDAVYDPPIYNCTSSIIQNILNDVIGAKTGSENVSVSSVLDQLTSATTPAKSELFAGDIVAIQAALVGVADIVSSRTNDTENQESNSDKFLDVANNLVDSRNADSWQSLIVTDGAGTDNVLGIIDKYTETLAGAKTVDNDSTDIGDTGVEFEYVESNLMLKVGTSTCSQQLEYPGRRTDVPAWITGTANRMQMPCTSVGARTSYAGAVYRNLSGTISLRHDNSSTSVSSGSSINGPVMSFSLFPKTDVTLEDPIEISFQIFNKELTGPVCSYWNTNTSDGRGLWSTEGCTLRSHSKSDGVVVCLCNHLTNFAILMSPAGSSEEHTTALSIVSAAGCSLSMLCLLLSFIVYVVYWRFVRCDRAIIHMHLFVCLFVAYALFLGGVTRTQIKALCTTIAALLHYVYLVVFMLMLTEGLDLGARILRASDRRRYWLVLLVSSYVIPAVIVGVALVINVEGYGNEKFCWLSTTSRLIWAFIAPVLAIILINGVLIVLVMKTLCATSSMQKKSDMERAKVGVRSICVLLPIMGVTWLFGVFSVNEDTVVFQYMFAICNSLQGLLIFIFHCLLNAKVQEGFSRTKARLFPSYNLSSKIYLPSSERTVPTASSSI